MKKLKPSRAWTQHELETLAKDLTIPTGVPLPRDPKLREAEIDRLAREGVIGKIK